MQTEILLASDDKSSDKKKTIVLKKKKRGSEIESSEESLREPLSLQRKKIVSENWIYSYVVNCSEANADNAAAPKHLTDQLERLQKSQKKFWELCFFFRGFF